MAGYPSAGKTFLGDYLATRGFQHIDGDQGGYSETAEIRQHMEGMWAAMQSKTKGGSPKPEEWQPFYKCLIDQALEASKKHEKVVVTFAVLGLFDGEIDFLMKYIPDIKLIEVKVDQKVLMKRFYERNEEITKQMGVTPAQIWKSDEMKDARATYGEEWTLEKQEAW